MRPHSHRSLRLRPLQSPRSSRLNFSTSLHRFSSASPTNPAPVKLAIIGSGLSGLSSAFYFLKSINSPLNQYSGVAKPSVEVVIFEKSKRTGGWCESLEITKKENGQGKLVFETGPRSIRPVALAGWLTVQLAHEIGLKNSEIITISKSSVSAKNRYVFYPDSLTLLPSSLLGAIKALLFTPLLRKTLSGILTEPFRRKSPIHDKIQQLSLNSSGTALVNTEPLDESVDAFFSRRFGTPLAENMISAMIHGIYSGDTRKLSMRALFPSVWEAERESRSIILGLLFSNLKRKMGILKESIYLKNVKADDLKMEEIKTALKRTAEGAELVERMEKASVWGVQGGLEKLTDRLRDYLVAQGVQIRMAEEGNVEQVKWENGEWKIITTGSNYSPTHLITTLPALLPTELAPKFIPSATVSVINLSFPSPPAPEEPLFPAGFGYLIPRSVKTEMNPHNVLGVIFDSDVMPGVDDTISTFKPASTPVELSQEAEIPPSPQTKISVLLGGSYWLPLPSATPSPLPTSASLENAALSTLALHFPNKKFPKPLYTKTSTHLQCIPQPPVGHHQLMSEFGEKLRSAGNVGVVGGGTGAVGVNGAVKAAWEVGTSFANSLSGGEKVKTGVEMWE